MDAAKPAKPKTEGGTDKPVAEWLAEMGLETKELFESLETYLLSLGDDVQRKDLKLYIAYKRLKNFVTVVMAKDRMLLYVKLNPDLIPVDETYMRDVRKIGHWGTGDLEISLRTMDDLDKIKALLRWAYEGER